MQSFTKPLSFTSIIILATFILPVCALAQLEIETPQVTQSAEVNSDDLTNDKALFDDLMLAVKEGDRQGVLDALQKGAPVNDYADLFFTQRYRFLKEYETPLHSAVVHYTLNYGKKAERFQIIEDLLQANADPDLKTGQFVRTPRMHAARDQRREILDLIEKYRKENPNPEDALFDKLITAIYFGDRITVLKAIVNGAPVNREDRDFLESPLSIAINSYLMTPVYYWWELNTRFAIIEDLLDANANPNTLLIGITLRDTEWSDYSGKLKKLVRQHGGIIEDPSQTPEKL